MASSGFATFILVLLFSGVCYGRIHLLPLADDERPIIVMTSFGYLQGGFLEVNITSMKITGANREALIGFSFDKSSSSGTSSYVEREESSHGCILKENKESDTFENVPRAILKIVHLGKNKYELQVKERGLQGLKFYPSAAAYGLQHEVVTKIPPTTSTTKVTTTLPTSSTKKETESKENADAEKVTEETEPVANQPKDEGKAAKKPDETSSVTSGKTGAENQGGEASQNANSGPVAPVTGGKISAGNGNSAGVASNAKSTPGASLSNQVPNNKPGQGTLRSPNPVNGPPGGSPARSRQGALAPNHIPAGAAGRPGRKKREAADDTKPKSKAEVVTTKLPEDATKYVSQTSIPIIGNFHDGMNFSFYVRMEKKEQIGLYELYFHNCENIGVQKTSNDDERLTKAGFTAHIVEKNPNSYLSAGDMALPTMYGIISVMFFLVGIVWMRMICTTQERVFKIHYLMAVIIFVKGLSVMFHSLDYYFIAKDGRTEAWAVIYYIVHLLKGILLIICLLLIGTGWAFIKYILSDRDKKLFMIVIPMQVMVNVAYIIMEETEEGNKSYYTWKNIVILVDVLCCGAILVPVVWSIRHLQEASQTDGKAAINLAKLELFRHFYIMVVCYLYFTRIIVYLLEITLPFQYIWIHAFFSELGAFIFFSVTGYKFRPGCDNPYLKLDQYDSDEDPEEAITQSGATENITRVNQREVEETDEFDVLLPKQRTSKV